MRGAEARGARADDGDIDGGGEGHDAVYLIVMPGLVPGIHVFLPSIEDVDGRDKPGHDGFFGALGRVAPPPAWPSPRACGRWRPKTSCAGGSISGSLRPVRRPRYRPAPFPASS